MVKHALRLYLANLGIDFDASHLKGNVRPGAAAAHHLAEEMQHTPQQNAKLSDPKKFAWPDYSALEAANIFASIAQRSRTELNPAAESSLFQEPKKQSNEEAGKEPKPHGQKREMRKIS